MIIIKRNISRFIELIIFIIALIILLANLMNVLIDKGTSTNPRLYNVYKGYAKNTDVLFVGSSHAGHLVGRNLWRDYGIAAYTIAGNSQPVDVTYHAIIEFLKYEEPKVIMMETALIPDDNMEEPDTEYEGKIQSDAAFSYSENYLQMAREQIENFSLPFTKDGIELLYKWPLMHSRYSELTKDDFVTDTPYLVSDVHPLYSVPEEEAEIVTTDERAPISDIGRAYLNKIITLCREKNIPLVLFHTPYPAPETSVAQQKTISDIASENNVPFIDFNYLVDEIGFDVQTDQAADLNHLNLTGGEKITEYLGQYLLDNYNLEDHRNDRGYETWEKDQKAWEDFQLKEKFENAGDIEEWSELFSDHFNNYLVIMTLSGDHTYESNGTIQNIIDEVPTPEGYHEKGGTIILYHGELLYYSDRADTYSYSHKFGNTVVSVDRLMPNQEYMSESDKEERNDGVYIWGENYIKKTSGLSITIYDESLDIIIDSVGISPDAENNEIEREEND
ncbi:hypothetical protein D6856_08650 [Butyrivibrio sp. XB500-5]|uniref:hypothetical protein n=1 Tax=Butyrivibrio sp. XB500-5 TaxID=2364880 RepID=UPI000EA93509|nr:hypothetical protein [Butyrivibrio sp. XB500-5]RKM60134.1 hypothetical protein D6856_08650 [Butyrivibrio sp. XB500-5]